MTQSEKTATSSWGTCLECRYLGEFSDLKMILFLLHKLIVCPPFCFCWFVISLYLQFILISCHGSFCYLLFVFATTFLLLLLLYPTLSCDLRETLSSVGRSVGQAIGSISLCVWLILLIQYIITRHWLILFDHWRTMLLLLSFSPSVSDRVGTWSVIATLYLSMSFMKRRLWNVNSW